jgi:phage gp45-like
MNGGMMRAKVAAARQVGGRVLLDVSGPWLDTRSRVELMLPAGFTVLPQPGADVLLLPSGAYGQRIAILPDDPGLRIAGLGAGEMGWRDYAGNQLLFKASGVELSAPFGLTINSPAPVLLDATGHPVTVKASRVNVGTGAQPVKLANNAASTNLYAD